MVLLDVNPFQFENFPKSFYIAKNALGIEKLGKTYAVCPECNTLYNVSEILTQDGTDQGGFKCTHIEFPNYPMRKLRQPCGAELIKEVPAVKGFVRRPKMVFSIPSLKMQIVTMYQRPDFEGLLQKWVNRGNELGLYTDIYDGEV